MPHQKLNEIHKNLVELQPPNLHITRQCTLGGECVIVFTDGSFMDGAPDITEEDYNRFLDELRAEGVEFTTELLTTSDMIDDPEFED
jgi:hypothetical protein